jgi:hypothetical protein
MYLPDADVVLSKSGRKVAMITATMKINFDWTCWIKIRIRRIAKARWVLSSMV